MKTYTDLKQSKNLDEINMSYSKDNSLKKNKCKSKDFKYSRNKESKFEDFATFCENINKKLFGY